MLLARTGIRACEDVRLNLADIDWAAGEITVHSNGRRFNKFPLMHDVGAALSDYLQNSRPRCSLKALFLCASAPIKPLRGPGNVSQIVKVALGRAKLNPKRRGAHLLRHSVATQALRHGATLEEAGQFLRHRRIDTTAIYAKVDFERLKNLTMPWLGSREEVSHADA